MEYGWEKERQVFNMDYGWDKDLRKVG